MPQQFASVRSVGTFDTNPFSNAAAVVTEVEQFVFDQLNFLKTSVIAPGLDTVDGLVTALTNFDFTLPDIPVTTPLIDFAVNFDLDLPSVTVRDFGRISPYELGAGPTPSSFPSVSSINIPAFNPSITAIHIPDAPAPGVFIEPGAAPDAPVFTFPDAPAITLPDRPLLNNVVIPEFVAPDLPTWEDITFPELTPMDINTFIDWTEPTYTPEIWADVKNQILRFFAGGSGLRPEIEEALVARGRDREDRLVRQQEQQAMDEWAGRGYTAPPGMLVKRIDDIREEGLLKKLSLQRDVVIKAMDEELANIRLGVQQGIVAEQIFVTIHLAAVDRMFQVQRLFVEWEIQKYNLLVTAFQAKMQEAQIRASIFEVRTRMALAELEVFKALLDAERVKAEINTTLVQAYTAEINARESLVNLYKTQIEAVGVRAAVFETEVRAYGANVSAFATRVDADKLRFDAYDSRVRGEVSKASIIESEARAYQAEVEGIGIGARAEVSILEAAISRFQAEIAAFDTQIKGQVARNQAEVAAIQGNVAGYQADTQRFVAQAGVEEASSRVELAAWQATNTVALALFDTQIKQFQAQLERIIQQKALLLDSIKSAGGLASTVAAGALAAMNIGATMSGQGGVSASGSDAVSFGQQLSESKSCDTSSSVRSNFTDELGPTLNCPF